MPDNDLENFRLELEELREALRDEKAAREVLRQRVAQQEAQIRELQNTTRNILQSRIWKALVHAGGALLGIHQRRQLVQRRLQFGMRKTLGLKATREAVHINRESPAPDSPPLSGKIKVSGWAVAETGIEKIEVSVGDKLYPTKSGLRRHDIALQYPTYLNSEMSGFRVVIDISHLPRFRTTSRSTRLPGKARTQNIPSRSMSGTARNCGWDANRARPAATNAAEKAGFFRVASGV